MNLLDIVRQSFTHKHFLVAIFDGAREGLPCHRDDYGECVYLLCCRTCNMEDLRGGNEIRAMLKAGHSISGAALDMFGYLQ